MFKKYFFVVLSLIFILIFLMSVSFTGCTDQVTPPEDGEFPPARLSSTELQVSNSAGSFGFKIFDRICDANPDSNVFISPLSISMALGMTLNGANADTYDAIQQTLELNGLSQEEINSSYKNLIYILRNSDTKIDFNIANSIWYKDTYLFEPDFMQRNIDYFDAVVQGVDFVDPATVPLVNNWVKNETNYMIEEIVKAFPSNTVMLLMNALYFKGIWEKEFNPDNTVDDLFDLGDNNYIACRMMVQRNEYSYFENDLFQAIDLPYGDGNFSMSLFLPRRTELLPEMISQMNDANWAEWQDSFTNTELDLIMPKFNLEFEIGLKEILSQMGMGIAFTGNADFTRMYAPGGLFISKVIHKANVEVNEEGTEASAVTAVIIVELSAPSFPTMRLDRPFVFVIHEKDSGAILFMGKINNPISEEE